MRKLILVAVLFGLWGCTWGIEKPYNPISPLSPLTVRGPEIPEGLENPKPQARGIVEASGTIPNYPRHLYLPLVKVSFPCGVNLIAYSLFVLMRDDPNQGRKQVICSDTLTSIAQARASDMATRQYFGHIDPDGVTPNEWAARLGCVLPSFYPAKGNTIESIGLNYFSAQDAWNAFLSSPGHRTHVLGLDPAFAQEELVGIGYVQNGWGAVTVIVSSKEC